MAWQGLQHGAAWAVDDHGAHTTDGWMRPSRPVREFSAHQLIDANLERRGRLDVAREDRARGHAHLRLAHRLAPQRGRRQLVRHFGLGCRERLVVRGDIVPELRTRPCSAVRTVRCAQ